ncbi:phosphoribosylanthranilate isomerase [Niallia sp. XMNu-256]|uniref:phosphoribosylanthranilate isomerase n=1 Tax=Niallia sp. XMNu-256 TaxID=3082444 RepID=UPI0030D532AD
MKVKICGITNEETAQFAVKTGADAIGFVFAESKRKVSLPNAKRIISTLPEEIKKVGVFVNPSRETIEETVLTTGIDTVQLHGNETPEFCDSLPYSIIKAFSIESKEDLEKIHDYTCEYVLLDGPKGKYYGGNGIAFDWELLSSFDFKDKKVILAGGLTIDNVHEAMIQKNVHMLDVSSGVETNGEKDLSKITKFISAVKGVKSIS